jgi:NAD(P)-dependent dehydrogenase (short-subunit alcohol dehydrogenase family)
MTNVVIGAASGMGTAVARALAPQGRLIIADRDLDGLKRVAAEIGGGVEAVSCDVTDGRQVDELVAGISELEAIAVTAGISTGSGAPGRRIFEVNLIGTARVLAAVEPLLRPGSVGVCFASISAHRVPDQPRLLSALDDPLSDRFFEGFQALGVDPDVAQFAYPMSKQGIIRMVRRLAPSWGARGARILSVSPGINDTPMNRADEARNPIMAEIIKGSPLGRRGRPAEVASVVAFLTSAGASYMTGTDILVDGGMVAALPQDTTGGRGQQS